MYEYQFGEMLMGGSYRLSRIHSKYYNQKITQFQLSPRSSLITNICKYNAEELIQQIIKINDEKICQRIKNQLKANKASSLESYFTKLLGEKVFECLDYIGNQNLHHQIATLKFLQSLQIIIQEFYIQIDSDFLLKLIDIIKNSENLLVVNQCFSVIALSDFIHQLLNSSKKSKELQFKKQFEQISIHFQNAIKKSLRIELEQSKIIIKILTMLDKLSIEEKLILELHCEWITQIINKQQFIQQKIQLQNRIMKYLKQNESKLLFSVINKLKVYYSDLFKKVSSEFRSININLQTLQLESKTKIIYHNMVNSQNIAYFITHQKVNLKQLLQNCIIIVENKIYVSLDLNILQSIQRIIEQRKIHFQVENDFTIKQILFKLIDNINLKLNFVCAGVMQQINIIEYICKLFQILVKYQKKELLIIKLKSEQQRQMYNQKIVQMLLRQLQKWLKQQSTDANYIKNIYGQIIFYATFYIYTKKQRNQLVKIYEKKAIQFMKFYQNIPPKWRVIKHAKYAIEYWSSQLQPKQQQVKRVTQIWLESYFNQNFEFIKGSYYFLKSQKINQKYLQLFSECLLKQIKKFTQQKLCKLNIEQQNNKILLNKFYCRIKIILKSQIKLSNANQIAKILYGQYQKNAHKLKYLRDLKPWIIQNYKSTITQQILKKQKQIQIQISQITLNYQTLKNTQQFLSSQPKQTFKNIEIIYKFTQIIPNLQLLINQLQLKSEKQIFPQQMYTILIFQIIKPLSKICYHINQQIYLNMTQSKEKVQQFEEIINKSILNATQAPYKILLQKYKNLQKIIYDYLCNISIKITLDEAQGIGKVIGILLNQYINQKAKNQKNSLSILQTINNMFETQLKRNNYDKSEEQEQQYVDQFQMGRNLYRVSPDIPLSIIIPIFSQQRQHFGQFVQSLIVTKNKVTTKEKYAWSCQKLLEGIGFKELKSNLDDSKEYLLAEQSKISSNILSYFVLPSLKVNKDSSHKISLSLYLGQIQLIFNNQYCQDHFQQFIQKIQTIFKYKNSKRNSYSFDRKFQIVENQQNFRKYEIQPIQLSFFKIQVKKILKNFIDKYPQQIFNNKSNKALQQLHYVISFMKNLEQQNQTEQVDSNYLLVKLIQKGQEFFKNYCVKLQDQNNNPNNDKNQKSSQESQKNSQLSQGNDNSQDLQMMRQKILKIQKKKNKKDFGLTVFFNILAKVERNNEKIVKKCFENGLQIQLLQLLKFSKQIQISDASQIFSFISQTLPPINIQIKKQDLLVIQNYYQLIINALKNLRYKKIYILVNLFKNLMKSANEFQKVGLFQFQNKILNTIESIIMKSLDCDAILINRKSQCEIISQICMANQNYIEKTLQFKIKHYIIKQYEKHLLKENTQQNQNTLMYQIKSNFIQIKVQKFRKAFEPELQKYPQIFYKLLKMLFDNYNEKNNTIIYSKGLETLCKFQSINRSFVECPISQRIKKLIVKLVQNFTRVRILGSQLVNERMVQLNQAKSHQQKIQIDQKFYKKINSIIQRVHSYLEILIQFVKQHHLLVPTILTTIVKNKFQKNVQFLDFLIEISIEEKFDLMIHFLVLFLSKNGLIVNYQQNKYYAQYLSAKIICKIIQKIQNNYQNKEILNNSVCLACFCLMFKHFNNLACLKISDRNETSLFIQLQNLIINHTEAIKQKKEQSDPPMQILYIQCLYLMYKNLEINKIKQKNQLQDFQIYSQIINKKLFGLVGSTEFDFFIQKQSRQLGLSQQQEDQINENFIVVQNKELNSIKNYFKWSDLQSLINQFKIMENRLNEHNIITDTQIEEEIIQISTALSLNNILAKNYNSPELQRERLSRKKKILSRRRGRYQYQAQVSNNYLPKPVSFQKYQKLYRYLRNFKKFLISSKYQIEFDEIMYLKYGYQSIISDRYERWNGQSMRDTLHQIQEQNNIQNFDPTNISRSDVEILIYKQFSLFLKDMNKKQHQNKMIQVKTQVRNFTEEQLKLRQNQNYKKLDNMNYVERFQFLTNQANDGYFLTLPSEISTQIKQQAQLLRNEKQRLKRQKLISSYDNQYMYPSQWFRSIRLRRMRLNNRKLGNKLKIIPLQQAQQIIIPSKCIQKILKSIFNREDNSQTSRFNQDIQEIANRGLRILLNLKNRKIKQKVLTTLLIIIKNTKAMKFRKYLQVYNKLWKMTENIKQTELQLIQKSVLKQILKTLQVNLKQQLTNNYQDLFSRNLNINEYYNIFEGQINNKCFSQQLGAYGEQYSPLNQFLSLALDHNHILASILMRNCKEVQNPIITKIFDLMKNNKIKSQSFYKNLSVISQNKLISQLFETNYTVNNPPSIQLLGRILKYKFGELKFAKQLHIKALREYKPTHDLYLKQILRFYSDHELNAKQYELSPYKQIYQTMLQKYYKLEDKEQDDRLIKLIKIPWILDYETKLAYFRNQVKSGQQYYQSRYIQLILDQNDILKSAYNQIMRLKKQQITKSNLYFKYSKSTSHGSGMIKVLNSLLKTQLIKPQTGLFKVIKDKQVALPNKAMLKNDPNYFNYFRFIGRIMAINVINDKNFPIPLPKVFFKMFLNNMLTWEDLEQVNEDMFYKARGLIMSRKQQPDTNVKQLELTFSYIAKDQNNNNIQIQLKKDGKNILVTNDNYEQFISLVVQKILLQQCMEQYLEMKQGFYELIPIQKFHIFTAEDIEKLICGIPIIDRKQFKQNCKLNGFTNQDQQIKWFWKFIDECSDEQLADVVQHFYGVSRLPEGGFKSIKTEILKLASKDTCPLASLCGGMSIKLPNYSSEKTMIQKIREAIKNSKCGQGLMEG